MSQNRANQIGHSLIHRHPLIASLLPLPILVLTLASCSGNSSADDTGTGQVTLPPTPLTSGAALMRGQRSQLFSLPTLSQGSTSLFSYEQSCNAGEGGSCCNLLIYQGGTTDIATLGVAGLFDIVLDPGSNVVRSLYGSGNSQALTAVMYADSSCSFTPVDVTTVPVESTLNRVDLMGQLGMHSDVDLQAIEGRQFFRDISRRMASGGTGQLGDIDSLFVARMHDYDATLPLIRDSNGGFLLKNSLVSFVAAEANEPNIRAAADALAYTQFVYDYYLEQHSLNGYDNRGSSMGAIIESPFPITDVTNTCQPGQVIPKGSQFNAFYVRGTPLIFFTPLTERSRQRGFSTTLSASLDTVAHEWAHAYLDGGARFAFERESGAMAEALADWLTIAVSRAAGRTGWLIGGDFQPDFAFRNMRSPRAINDEIWEPTDVPQCSLCNDFCGVHSNNGVANYMFYLLSEGGQGMSIDGKTPVAVTGIGIDRAVRVAIEANSNFWTSRSDFRAARTGMEMAATSLFSADPSVATQVARAWAAVGVGELP